MALYTRVPIRDKGQDVELQLRALPTYATTHEWETFLAATPEIKDFPFKLRVTLQPPRKEATIGLLPIALPHLEA